MSLHWYLGWAEGESPLFVTGKVVDPKFPTSPDPNTNCYSLAMNDFQPEDPSPGMSGSPILNQDGNLVGIYLPIVVRNVGTEQKPFTQLP